MHNSRVILCNGIKLDRSYNNVLNYTESDMLNLCTSHQIASANNFNFIKRGSNTIEVPFTYEQCLKSNYIAFQNVDYSNKWFFAFVDDVEFRNPNTTRISFTIDVFATWFDYWDAHPVFVEREHVTDDTIGLHTLDEGLDIGEYVINHSIDLYDGLQGTWTCIGCTFVPDNTPFFTPNRVYGGIFSGVSYLLFKTIDDASNFIKGVDKLGRDSSTSILFVTEIPRALTGVSGNDERWFGGDIGGVHVGNCCLMPNIITQTLTNAITLGNPATLNGYTPKNNKMFCSPFNLFTINNNAGTQAEFHYEDFINNTANFDIVGTPSPSCSIMLIPKNYKKSNISKNGYPWGIPVAKYPQGSWQSDLFTNWEVTNGINLFGHQIDASTSHYIRGGLQALTSAATLKLSPMDSAGGIMGGFSEMLSAVQEKYRASLMPPAIGGQVNQGDLTFAYGKMSPTYYNMCLKYEYAKICDDWLSRFGYKVNRVKIPNQVGRTYWNYVKIGAGEIIGYPNNKNYGIPKDDMEQINNIYRRGTTIWHQHDNIGNFNLNNTIVTP